LLGLDLCSPADLRRAGRQVRRLARDLPAFDSAWLDALVRIGKLTPFQSRVLESTHPERIRVGPCVLVNRLGGGPLGETFVARANRSREPCAVKRLATPDELSTDAEERLIRLIDDLRGFDHPSVAVPIVFERAGGQAFVVSRFVAGMHLGELLVRRGRFPAVVVWEIARQLAEGLDALERRETVHGDIRAANVRLTTAGVAVLVDTGIRAAMDCELSVHSNLPVDRYDGVAPERIGSATRPTIATDMYALGCLLWQLLAGRPPFPGGDPLVKLAAHQTRSIDDVRRWAPDTPSPLAEGIRRLTAHRAADRPLHFSEVLELWGSPRRRGRRRLAAFRRWFDAPVPMRLKEGQTSRSRRWPAAIVLSLVAALTAISLDHQGANNVLLAWRSRNTAANSTAERDRDSAAAAADPIARARAPIENSALVPADEGLDLPAPDRLGVMHLESAGRYRVRDVAAVGDLVLAGQPGAAAEIVIRNRPLKLSAETIRLENVRLRHVAPASGASGPPAALVMVQCQTLALERCELEVADVTTETGTTFDGLDHAPRIGLGWKLVDPHDKRGGQASFRDTIVAGGDVAVFFADAVRRVEFVNCLRLAGGPLGHLAAPLGARGETAVRLECTTCRESVALFRIAAPRDGSAQGRITIEAIDCVLDLDSDTGHLFELVGDERMSDRTARTSLTGEGSLAPSGLRTAVRVDPRDDARFGLDGGGIPVEGLLAGPYRFAGPRSLRPADSEVREYEAPRRSPRAPGIRAAGLP
jgi:serine/threonine protein kinase